MAGYATRTANYTEEEEEEENLEGNCKQPATNPIGGSRGWAQKGWGTWMGTQRGYQTSPKRRKKKNKQQEIANILQGTLLGEIKAGKTKMSPKHAGDSFTRRNGT